jgi:hypothetical protein
MRLEMTMLTMSRKLIAGCLLVTVLGVLATYYFFSTDVAQTSKVQGNLQSATAVESAGYTSANSARRTHTNVQITSSAQVALKRVTLSKPEMEAHPKFWMLAYSEHDIGWLAHFGYPTLEEESRLNQATIEQLSALAEAGNLNAKVHLGVRLAMPALMSNDPRPMLHATTMIQQSLIEGGPYQAAKTAEFFVNLAKNRRALGDLNDEQRTALQKELLPLYELARGLSSMYGDFAAVRNFNAYRNLDVVFGLPANPPMPFDVAMARFSNMNKARVQRGLEPYQVIPRPSPPGPPDVLSFQETNTVFVR